MSKFIVEPISKSLLLGEAPHWCQKTSKLYFVDIFDNRAGLLDVKTGEITTLFETDTTVSAVLPVEGSPNQILVSTPKDILLVNTDTKEAKRIDGIGASKASLNDAKCDSKGRLWIGSMGPESSPGGERTDEGSLYKLGDDGKLEVMMDKMVLSNGMCWSHDNQTMYFADSVKRIIYAMDFDSRNGTISPRRVLTDMKPEDGFQPHEGPDGMTIDADGNLWVAMFFGSRIVQIDSQTGKALDAIEMPTDLITSVCFGGSDLTEMYATTCKNFLPEEKQAAQPEAGKVFRITAPGNDKFRGLKANYNLKSLANF